MSLSSFSMFTRSPLCSPKLSAHSFGIVTMKVPAPVACSFLTSNYGNSSRKLQIDGNICIIRSISMRYLLVRRDFESSILILFQPFLCWRHDNPPRKLRL